MKIQQRQVLPFGSPTDVTTQTTKKYPQSIICDNHIRKVVFRIDNYFSMSTECWLQFEPTELLDNVIINNLPCEYCSLVDFVDVKSGGMDIFKINGIQLFVSQAARDHLIQIPFFYQGISLTQFLPVDIEINICALDYSSLCCQKIEETTLLVPELCNLICEYLDLRFFPDFALWQNGYFPALGSTDFRFNRLIPLTEFQFTSQSFNLKSIPNLSNVAYDATSTSQSIDGLSSFNSSDSIMFHINHPIYQIMIIFVDRSSGRPLQFEDGCPFVKLVFQYESTIGTFGPNWTTCSEVYPANALILDKIVHSSQNVKLPFPTYTQTFQTPQFLIQTNRHQEAIVNCINESMESIELRINDDTPHLAFNESSSSSSSSIDKRLSQNSPYRRFPYCSMINASRIDNIKLEIFWDPDNACVQRLRNQFGIDVLVLTTALNFLQYVDGMMCKKFSY